jgi:dihydrofolate reductase
MANIHVPALKGGNVRTDLIDEYALHVYPLVLGSGKRLFPAGKRLNLKLVESQALPTGVVVQRYRPVM